MPESSPATLTQALRYDHFTSSIYNLDFKGAGHLTIDPAGPTYTFTGRRRGLFAGGQGELTLGGDDIRNVEVLGNVVRFKTGRGKSGAKGRPFAVHLPDAATAGQLAAMFPGAVDEQHEEAADFATRLASVTGPQTPWSSVTNLIVVINLLVFVAMGLAGAGWIETGSIMPYVRFGANNGAATTDGEWWRLLTSMFMHYGVLHLAFNMWALYQAGHFLEKLLGWPAYALTYLSSGIVGGFASIYWNGDQTWSAGASGAVFGVYGAILGYMLREKQSVPKSVYQRMMKSTLTFTGYNVLYGAARAGIDNSAHLGGLAAGVLFGWLLALPLDQTVRARETRRRLQLGVGAFVVLAAIGVAVTPRFNYRISEVLAWSDVVEVYAPQEAELLPQQQQRLNGLIPARRSIESDEALADWIETKMVPLYENWARDLSALELAAEKETAHTREGLLEVFELKLANYRRLVSGLRNHDAEAVQHYESDEKEVSAALARLQPRSDEG